MTLLVFCKHARRQIGTVKSYCYPYHIPCPHCGGPQKFVKIYSLNARQAKYVRFRHFAIGQRRHRLLKKLYEEYGFKVGEAT